MRAGAGSRCSSRGGPGVRGRRRPRAAPPERDSAGRLVDRVLVLSQVVLGDDREPGADLRLGGLALQRGDGLLDALLADLGRLLGDEGLDRALLEVLDLLRAGVEADDLDLAELAGLTQAGSGALGPEQVRGEDAGEIGVLGQRG